MGAAMKVERSKVADLMTDAHRAVLGLDDFTRRDGSKAMTIAIKDGMRVYSMLTDHRQTERMSAAESSLIQTAIDLLRARLRFFGEVV
jgi:predicted regulator of Ras-like GTPase activity (Roadblock/LC7/MglB family)